MDKRENTVKPGKNLKMAAGLVISAAAATVAAMAYKVNEDKINAGVDKVADGTKTIIEKASKKVKEIADDIMDMTCEEKAAEASEASGKSGAVDVEASEVTEEEIVAAEVVEPEGAVTEEAQVNIQ